MLLGTGSFVAEALDDPTARAVAESLFRGAGRLLMGKHNPRGCMFVRRRWCAVMMQNRFVADWPSDTRLRWP
jgi:hypothetical protein